MSTTRIGPLSVFSEKHDAYPAACVLWGDPYDLHSFRGLHHIRSCTTAVQDAHRILYLSGTLNCFPYDLMQWAVRLVSIPISCPRFIEKEAHKSRSGIK